MAAMGRLEKQKLCVYLDRQQCCCRVGSLSKGRCIVCFERMSCRCERDFASLLHSLQNTHSMETIRPAELLLHTHKDAQGSLRVIKGHWVTCICKYFTDGTNVVIGTRTFVRGLVCHDGAISVSPLADDGSQGLTSLSNFTCTMQNTCKL